MLKLYQLEMKSVFFYIISEGVTHNDTADRIKHIFFLVVTDFGEHQSSPNHHQLVFQFPLLLELLLD